MGSPAHAGIDLFPFSYLLPRGWFPRTRGDRPRAIQDSQSVDEVPPHTRG